jgi:hypothetical protein
MPPKKDDAIREDVSDANEAGADNTETTERPKSMRELGMEMMAERRREELVAEGVELEAPTTEGAKKDEGAADDVDAQITAQADDAATDEGGEGKKSATGDADEVTDGDEMVKVKVNGVEELVPLKTVVAQYQKNSAADKRLEDATRLLEEAKQMQAAATTTREKKSAQDAVDTATGNLAEVKEKFFNHIYEGQTEDASKLFDQLVKDSVTEALKTHSGATDKAAIIAEVTPAVEQSLAMKGALRTFKKDFPKIASDPYLAARADAYLKESLDGGKPIDEAFKDAGEKTMGWMRDTLGVKTSVTVSTARTEKTGKKEGIDNPTSTGAKTEVPQAPVQQNVSQSISEMRKGRVTG